MRASLLMMTILGVMCGAAGTLPVQAQDAAPSEKDYPVLEKLKGKSDNLTYDFLGKKFGLDAWLLSGPELMQVVYVLPEHKTALVGGTLVGQDGKEAGSALLQDFLKDRPERAEAIVKTVRSDILKEKAIAPVVSSDKSVPSASKTAASPSEVFWDRLAHVGTISFGSDPKAPLVYAVMDPTMAETAGLWHVLLPLAEKGHVNLVVVPLAVSTADSIMDIAIVLGDEDPQLAWKNLLTGKKPDVTSTPASHGVLRMQTTVELAQAMNLRELPLLVYRSAVGKEAGPVRMLRGVPKDWTHFLTDLGVGQNKKEIK